MKNFLLLFVMLAMTLVAPAQVSDITIDKCNFESHLVIEHADFTGNPTDAACYDGFYQLSDNKILRSWYEIVNMGPDTAHFGDYGVEPRITHRPCNWPGFSTIDSLFMTVLKDEAGNIVRTSVDNTSTLEDNHSYLWQWNSTATALSSCQLAYLSQYGNPLVNPFIHPDDNLSSVDNLGLSPGFSNTSEWFDQTGINITGLPDGNYQICPSVYPTPEVNEGANAYPNGFCTNINWVGDIVTLGWINPPQPITNIVVLNNGSGNNQSVRFTASHPGHGTLQMFYAVGNEKVQQLNIVEGTNTVPIKTRGNQTATGVINFDSQVFTFTAAALH